MGTCTQTGNIHARTYACMQTRGRKGGTRQAYEMDTKIQGRAGNALTARVRYVCGQLPVRIVEHAHDGEGKGQAHRTTHARACAACAVAASAWQWRDFIVLVANGRG